MIQKIIQFSVQNKLIIGLFTIAIVVGGIWSANKVPLDAVPDITNNQVQVITQAPNLGTEDIEQFVTYPVELAMANLPGVVEIRSVSRFGLSVVTIVFEDDMGTYLPRQLVDEKLSQIKKEIPEDFGEPEMGPISTGLGEIYQYTLEVDDEFKGKYTNADLRSIQDWIIRRQMAMVTGVVEVNAFGGDIKQYEVAVNPDKLRSMDLTISDVFNALQVNNENTGGAYIEKSHIANFIRGEGLIKDTTDIQQIVVKNVNGIPVTIKDVAKVQFGKAVRYGALTKDGEGEAVGGMILMLKDANSDEVIKAVKERMGLIQKSLPEGVHIQPFLDRSDLIGKTTSTVSQNLMEGALIVIFVLVFLLGNWRGGLIVASTIPLSLLFAFILMYYFDVWANLMSLGAIDFGIIVDGAVIIVEGTVFLFHEKLAQQLNITSEHRDDMAHKAGSKMMRSAFFGQLIILIVFIPILGLQGVEGKMFKPMAMTFIFAMIGAMILCLTYVPMMSSWFLRAGSMKVTWGDKLILGFEKIYEKVLGKALKFSLAVIGISITFLAIAIFSFTRMGGEFIPQLDEGDLAFHVILKPGSSLSETVETTTKVEQIVKENFPEVKHIYSRIGVAEVPTDPMPMDVADVIVTLKDQDEWVSADSKEELIEKMKAKVLELPGVNYEFTQPIEMRFNELITGVREDVAIKLFGEDLSILSEKVNEISKIIASVEGIGDMKVEATDGLPQMTVRYERQKIAQYGLNISDLNQLIQTAFGGGTAGIIFEGERRYDLVVRLDSAHRKGIENLKNIYISTPTGAQIPLKEVAHVDYESGPMQISRDNTNRRAYVGINVRGRDVQSLVEEIKAKLDAELELPPGYYIRYGGAFENLERASNRLKLLVPVALGLIFLLIFFALKSIKQTLMIYIAIPLSAIGGVFFLMLRDMPFSISAGVGFIVLFGVAVLNGLVLINGWNELKEEGVDDLDERIKLGSRRRIRPILLTALTDILGFLPMAISTSAGAEVQQPLATVVIGGMISATFLTLIVLPILYKWTEKNQSLKVNPKLAGIVLVLVSFGVANNSWSQSDSSITNLNDAIKIGMDNNNSVGIAESQIQMYEQKKKASFNPGKTNFDIEYGQLNSFENDFTFSFSQTFEFPTVYTSRLKYAKQQIQSAELHLEVVKNKLKWHIRQNWFQLAYLEEYMSILVMEDSLMQRVNRATKIRYEVEATNQLEKVSAETKLMEIRNQINILEADQNIQQRAMSILLNDSLGIEFNPQEFQKADLLIEMDSAEIAQNPSLAYIHKQIEVADADIKVNSNKLWPDLKLGYYNQSMIGSTTKSGNIADMNDRFSVFQAGITIPLFFGSYRSAIKSAKIQKEIAEFNAKSMEISLNSQFEMKTREMIKNRDRLKYYEEHGLKQADLLIANAQKSFELGAINYLTYYQSLNQGIQIKKEYIKALTDYNKSIVDLAYLVGK